MLPVPTRLGPHSGLLVLEWVELLCVASSPPTPLQVGVPLFSPRRRGRQWVRRGCQGGPSRGFPAQGQFPDVPELLLREEPLPCDSGRSAPEEMGEFSSPGMKGGCVWVFRDPQAPLSGSGQGTWRLRDLGVLLGYGHPTQVLNSGVHLGRPGGTWPVSGASGVRREVERRAGWKALGLRHELWSQTLSLLPVPPGARGLPSLCLSSFSEIMLD